MCGQPTSYNTYATLAYTNPLFMGFSGYLNVNKEIGKFTIQNIERYIRDVYYTPGLMFWGVFCIKYGRNLYIKMQF